LCALVLHKHDLLLLFGFLGRSHPHVGPEEQALREGRRDQEENTDEVELGHCHSMREEAKEEVEDLDLTHDIDNHVEGSYRAKDDKV
jgi:hypothetical protein